MRPANPVRHTAAPLFAALALAACGGSGSEPMAAAEPGCAAAQISLPVGESRPLTTAEAACIRLPDEAGRYVLAGYDPAGGEFTVRDATAGAARSSAPSFSSSANANALAPQGRPVFVSAPAKAEAPDPAALAGPLAPGDAFQVRTYLGPEVEEARVLDVAGGIVLAAVDRHAQGASGAVKEYREALARLVRNHLPLYAEVYGGQAPATGRTGQLLVLLTAWDPEKGSAATWVQPGENGRAQSYVILNLNVRGEKEARYAVYDHVSMRLRTLAHELSHAWAADHLARAGRLGKAPAWASEGSADLVAGEVLRRELDIPLLGNWRWHDHVSASDHRFAYAMEPALTTGYPGLGYRDAASFLLDLHTRLVRRGVSPVLSLQAIARGAIEGTDGAGPGAGSGLAARLAEVGTQGWDAADAVTLWAVSQAADDHTRGSTLENAAYHDAAPVGGGHGWQPAGTLETQSGKSARVSLAPGATFYVFLDHRTPGGAFAAQGPANARWRIARQW